MDGEDSHQVLGIMVNSVAKLAYVARVLEAILEGGDNKPSEQEVKAVHDLQASARPLIDQTTTVNPDDVISVSLQALLRIADSISLEESDGKQHTGWWLVNISELRTLTDCLDELLGVFAFMKAHANETTTPPDSVAEGILDDLRGVCKKTCDAAMVILVKEP